MYPPHWGSKFFFFFNLSSFNPLALFGPELILRCSSWNFCDYAALKRCLTKTISGAERTQWSNTSPYSGARSWTLWLLRVLYEMPFCSISPQSWTFVVLLFHSTARNKNPKAWFIFICAARLITAFAWHSDVEMSHHQSVLKTQTWLRICLFLPSFPLFRMKIGQLLYIIPVASLLQFPLCLSDIINSCEFVYSAHLNIAVNKLVSVMLKFVVLHG